MIPGPNEFRPLNRGAKILKPSDRLQDFGTKNTNDPWRSTWPIT